MKRTSIPVLTLAVLALGSIAAAAPADRGEIRVATPSIPAAKRFEPLEIIFEVRPPPGTKGSIEASLILTSLGGKPRTYPARSADGKTFRATAIPSQPEDSSRVRVTLIDEVSELVFETPDRSITVGGKALKLSEVRRIELRDDARLINDSGDVQRGALAGLETLEAQVGGQTLRVEPLKAIRLLVNRVENALPIVSYRIVAKWKDQVVAETSGRIEFKGSPVFPPAPVRPAAALAFEPPVLYEVPDAADIVTAGDIDGDRRTDIVVGGGETLGALYGRGDGTFEPFRPLLTWKARVANRLLTDLNGDRLPEIIFSDSIGRMVVLVNHGARKFEEPKFQSVGNTHRMSAADFNRDGWTDLAITESKENGGDARVLLGFPDGVFREDPGLRVKGFNYGIAAADINGDGALDLALGHGDSSRGGVGLFYGSHDRGFRVGPSFRYGTGNTLGVCIGDLNRDGAPDVVGADYWGGKLLVMINNGDGSFQPPVPYPGGPHPLQIYPADIDGDGKTDLAVAGAGQKYVLVYRNRGDGSFHDPVEAPSGGDNGRSCVVADLNRDGRPDFVIAHELKEASVAVILNQGGK
jgi:hypothetical protein